MQANGSAYDVFVLSSWWEPRLLELVYAIFNRRWSTKKEFSFASSLYVFVGEVNWRYSSSFRGHACGHTSREVPWDPKFLLASQSRFTNTSILILITLSRLALAQRFASLRFSLNIIWKSLTWVWNWSYSIATRNFPNEISSALSYNIFCLRHLNPPLEISAWRQKVALPYNAIAPSTRRNDDFAPEASRTRRTVYLCKIPKRIRLSFTNGNCAWITFDFDGINLREPLCMAFVAFVLSGEFT